MLQNLSDHTRRYKASGHVRYTDFSSSFASVRIAVGDEQLALAHVLARRRKKVQIHVEVTLDPSPVPKRQQEYGRYFINPNVDGNVDIVEIGPRTATSSTCRGTSTPLAVRQLASRSRGRSTSPADPPTDGQRGRGGGPTPTCTCSARGPGRRAGARATSSRSAPARSPAPTVTAIGGGRAERRPNRSPARLARVPDADTARRPSRSSSGRRERGIHNTTETLEVDVLVDVGADGVFADDTLDADVLIVEAARGRGGEDCVFVLPSDLSACDAGYFQDYSNYNASIWGIPVDAGPSGCRTRDARPVVLDHRVLRRVRGRRPRRQVCDTVGEIDPATGTYGPTIDVTDPALTFSTAVVGGFFGGPSGPVSGGVGSAGAGDDPSILAVYPNNHPDDQGPW